MRVWLTWRCISPPVLSLAPPDTNVALVSVVGAFRTGKSFLLSWFLRYLNATSIPAPEPPADGTPWYKSGGKLSEGEKFEWRGGEVRHTTGIWMWSKPFLRKLADGSTVAMILVDTQGMFDHETTMGLTAAIFGLSTLLSSYQIYNVSGRIQEDHLQQLALFAEYGRMALNTDHDVSAASGGKTKPFQVSVEKRAKHRPSGEGNGPRHPQHPRGQARRAVRPCQPSAQPSFSPPSPPPSSWASSSNALRTAHSGGLWRSRRILANLAPYEHQTTAPLVPLRCSPPPRAQRIDFLVRDWSNFDDEEEEEPDFAAMETQMDDYLQEVIKERDAADLAETRQQITSCFDKVGCYLLTHPGLAVTKKKYDGAADSIEPIFFSLLDRYCDKVFNKRLRPKRIHGRHLTATELGEYIKAYASMFKGGAEFPQATTMLAATADANNSNAKTLAIGKYKSEMDRACGVNCSSFLQSEEFEEHHVACNDAATAMFDHMATFGSEASITTAREVVTSTVTSERKTYLTLNDSRNPLAGFETFYLPLIIGLVSFVSRSMLDLTCSGWSSTCKAGSDFSGQIFSLLILGMIIMGATKAKLIKQRVEMIMKVVNVSAPKVKAR